MGCEAEWLNSVIDALNPDYSAEFALSREYLDLYTKDQLAKLAREAKIKTLTKQDITKKGTLIDAILARAPPGFVPKNFRKAGVSA